MSDFATQIVQARMLEVNNRLAQRMQEISGQTGIRFSDMFSQQLARAATVTESDTQPETAETEKSTAAEDAEYMSGTASKVTGAAAYSDLIERVSAEHGVSASLVKALTLAESNYNPNAKSSAGAMGLMQLMPEVAAAYGVTDAYDPEQNVEAGVRILAEKLDNYNGNVRMALASYNMGTAGLAALGLSDLYDEDQFAAAPADLRNYLTRIEGFMYN